MFWKERSDYDIDEHYFDQDPLAWSMPLGMNQFGDFSMATVQSHVKMEDRNRVHAYNGALFVGVYDGYKGDTASEYIMNHALFDTILGYIQKNENMSVDILRQVVSETEAGFIQFATNLYKQHRQPEISFVSSGCLICIIWRGTVYLANVGSSRAILGSQKSVSPIKRLRVKQMGRDHNCNNLDIQKELFELHPDNKHICFNNFGAWRVNGLSETSRCIGYAYMKAAPFTTWKSFKVPLREQVTSIKPMLSAEPDTYSRVLKFTDKFIIFGSGGFWKLVTNEQAADIVNASPRNGIAKKLAAYSLQVGARKMNKQYRDILEVPKGNFVSGRRSIFFQGTRPDFHDDITVIVIYLDKGPNEGVGSKISSFKSALKQKSSVEKQQSEKRADRQEPSVSKNQVFSNLDQLPVFMHKYFKNVVNVEGDGNCGFRAVAGLLNLSHQVIRNDLLTEVNGNLESYRNLFGQNDLDSIKLALAFEVNGPAPLEKWMLFPEMGLIVAQKYETVVVVLSRYQHSETYFPFRCAPKENNRLICLGYVNNNHFMQIYLQDGCPIPPASVLWKSKCATNELLSWENIYLDRMTEFSELNRAQRDVHVEF